MLDVWIGVIENGKAIISLMLSKWTWGGNKEEIVLDHLTIPWRRWEIDIESHVEFPIASDSDMGRTLGLKDKEHVHASRTLSHYQSLREVTFVPFIKVASLDL